LFRGDYTGAEVDLNKAILLKSDDIDVYYFLGLTKDYQGYYDEAILNYDIMISKDKNNLDALNGIANVLRKTDDINEAHRIIDIAIDKKPKVGAFYGTKSAIYSSENDTENFYKYFEKALSFNAKASNLHEDIKAKYFGEERFKEVLQKYEQTL
jgi:tetratricopeptide (TPR) repeat protein